MHHNASWYAIMHENDSPPGGEGFLYFLATIKRDFPPISSPQSNRIWRTALLITDYTISHVRERREMWPCGSRIPCIYIYPIVHFFKYTKLSIPFLIGSCIERKRTSDI